MSKRQPNYALRRKVAMFTFQIIGLIGFFSFCYGALGFIYNPTTFVLLNDAGEVYETIELDQTFQARFCVFCAFCFLFGSLQISKRFEA